MEKTICKSKRKIKDSSIVKYNKKDRTVERLALLEKERLAQIDIIIKQQKNIILLKRRIVCLEKKQT